jgi:hypothetical protein
MQPASKRITVPWGTHFCQFYQEQHDPVDIPVPYFKAGLENNEFCMCEPRKIILPWPLLLDGSQGILSAVQSGFCTSWE